MVRLLANENFPIASVRLLRKAGYDILAIAEEMPGLSDEKVLLIAETQRRVIITFDRDYGELIYRYKKISPLGTLFTFCTQKSN